MCFTRIKLVYWNIVTMWVKHLMETDRKKNRNNITISQNVHKSSILWTIFRQTWVIFLQPPELWQSLSSPSRCLTPRTWWPPVTPATGDTSPPPPCSEVVCLWKVRLSLELTINAKKTLQNRNIIGVSFSVVCLFVWIIVRSTEATSFNLQPQFL